MNRIATITVLAASLLFALPAVAQTGADADRESTTELMTTQNALYASARAVRDQMNDLRESGRLATEAGQTKMATLVAELDRIEDEVRSIRAARKTLIAQRRSERLRQTRTVALRDRSEVPRAAAANASR
mgnify:CR=1 FL=1